MSRCREIPVFVNITIDPNNAGLTRFCNLSRIVLIRLQQQVLRPMESRLEAQDPTYSHSLLGMRGYQNVAHKIRYARRYRG
jgi:hypothetical protein